MPQYTVHDPRSNRTITLTGDSPPTEQELHQIFAQVNSANATAPAPPAAPSGLPPNLQKYQGMTPMQMIEAGRRDDEAQRMRQAEFGPMAGGLVGGLMGGPLGAAVGGGAGEAARQAVRRDAGQSAPETVKDQTIAIAKEGAMQGALEGGGRVVAAGAGKAATFLMNRAANVTDRLAREFPELSQTLIDNAIKITNGGYEKAKRLLAAAKGEANVALANAEKQGLTVELQLTPDLANSLKAAVTEQAMKTGKAAPTRGQPLSPASQRLDAATQQLITKIDQAVANNAPLTLTPTQADLFKTQLQRESKNAVYAARLNPNGTPAIKTEATEKAEYAAQLNNLIDDIAAGYKDANAKAREMLGATRAVRQAVRPGKNLYMAMVRPTTGAVLGSIAGQQQGSPGMGAALGAAAATPAGMSMGAIGLGHPVVRQLLSQLPRGVAALLMEALRSPEAPPTQ